MNSLNRTQKGFSLIELMIAMVIGLVLLGGVLGIFIATQQTNRTQDAMSSVQENGRLALEILARDIRESGQSICAGNDRFINLLNPNTNHYPGFFFDNWNPVTAPQQIAAAAPNRHILTVNAFESLGIYEVSAINGNRVTLDREFNDGVELQQGQIIAVAGNDNGVCELFDTQIQSDDAFERPAPGADQPPVIYNVNEEVEIFAVVRRSYFIERENNVFGLHRSSQRLLSDGNHLVNNENLVDGLFDLRIEYGEDTSGDGHPDSFAFAAPGAPPNWSRVVGVRAHLLSYSHNHNTVVAQNEPNQVVQFPGVLHHANDVRGHLFQGFTTTVAIRNARDEVN